MSATTADLNAARTGLRIAVIARTHDAARVELERLAPFAGPDATIRRAKDRARISYGGEGGIRFHSAAALTLRGRTYDRIHLAPDAVTPDAIADARAALTPTGELYIGARLVDDERDDADS